MKKIKYNHNTHQVNIAYGMRFADVFEGTADRFQYGGKEIDRFSGLDLHDFSARWYDQQLCRFTSPDPLQEKYPHLSPYCYGLCNPILYVDPDGRDAQITIDDRRIIVRARIILMGDLANDELVRIYQNDINSKWGEIQNVIYKGEKYSISWDVEVRLAEEGEEEYYNGINNYMQVVGNENSKVIGSNHGDIRSEGRDGYSLEEDCPMSHEFGHMLGLDDKYSYNKSNYGKPVSPKWKGDIMAEITSNPVKISNMTLTELFGSALKKHTESPWLYLYKKYPRFGRFFNLNKTIVYVK